MAALSINYREQYARYSRYFKNLAQNYGQKPAVRRGLELLLTLLTISFFAVFAIRPTANTIAHLIADIKTQQEIKDKLNQKIDNLKRAQAIFAKEGSRLTFLAQALTQGPQPEQFARQLEGLAKDDGVSLESLNVAKIQLYGKPPPTQEKKVADQFEVSFLVSGSYRNILTFLEDIESLRRLTSLTTVTIASSKKTGEEGKILLNLGAQVPYYPVKTQK